MHVYLLNLSTICFSLRIATFGPLVFAEIVYWLIVQNFALIKKTWV